MGRTINIQDGFLNQLRRDNVPVTIYLVNGVQIKGCIKSFDNFTVMIESDGRQMMVYKHALSTIAPNLSIRSEPTEPARSRPDTGSAVD